jgi:hypothetical protein
VSGDEPGCASGPASQPIAPEVVALVRALKEQTRTMDRLSSSIGQMTSAVMLLLEHVASGDDEPEQSGTYLDGKPR